MQYHTVGLTVIPVTAKRQRGIFDLFGQIISALEENQITLKNGDILAVSTKYVSNSQGRLVFLDTVSPSNEAKNIAKKFKIRPEMAEAILRESDHVFGGVAGFVISDVDGIMAPNAGIDKSNAKKDWIILYPNDAYRLAEELKRRIFLEYLIHVGIIFVDSRLLPARSGTSGVAVACAGIEPIHDMRAKKDLDGNPLKVTVQATADNLGTIANHTMGEGAESRPISIIRDSDTRLTDRTLSPGETAVSHEQCVYVRGLRAKN